MQINSNSQDPRFRGNRALFGDLGSELLQQASVAVVGVGGVGSWAVECLARAGIGQITLVDLDDVCITNVNRQLAALTETVGLPKVEVLRDRVAQINPNCQVRVIKKFFSAETAEQIFSSSLSMVLDCIDRVTAKAELLSTCRVRGIPVITTGAAGERLDPTKIEVSDLSATRYDLLLAQVRKKLRTEHQFPRNTRHKFDIPCVYYPQQRGAPDMDADAANEWCERKTCNDGLGSFVGVTATMGFMAASIAIQQLLSGTLHDKN